MEGKIAVFGDADFVMPFSALGADTFPIIQTETIAQTADRIISGKYAMIVVAENIAPKVEEVFSDYQNTTLPCIVVVPFTTESEGFATRALGEVLKMATGIDILQNS